MTSEEVMGTLHTLAAVGCLIADLPLEDLLYEYSHWDSIGPILRPTEWIAGQDNIRDQERMVRAAREFQKVVLDLRRSEVAP